MNYIEVFPMEILQGFTENESYILMLMEPLSGKSIPVLIGNNEAQNIIMAQEDIHGQRPMTHELMHHIMKEFTLSLKKVTIDRFEEGVFYASLYITDGFYDHRIDSRTSDAVTQAILWGTSIWMNDEIIRDTGIDASTLVDGAPPVQETESREQLEQKLRECEEKEDFERAAEIAKKLKELDS